MIYINFHDAMSAELKAIDDKEVIRKVLKQELEIKSKGLGYSQKVIDSCEASLKEMSNDART